jgi:hypothetical protein
MAFLCGKILSLIILALASLGMACIPGQARDWDVSIVSTILKPPSWPQTCHAVYIWSEGDRLKDLYEHFGIAEHQLREWNCFLRQDVLRPMPNQKLCVDATLDGFRVDAQYDATTKHGHSSSKHQHPSSSSSWTHVLEFTTYPIYWSTPIISTYTTPTVRYWTTYPTPSLRTSSDEDESAVTTPTVRYWTTYSTAKAGTESETKKSLTGRTSKTRTRSKTSHTRTHKHPKSTTHHADPTDGEACKAPTAAEPSPTKATKSSEMERRRRELVDPSTEHVLKQDSPALSQNSIKSAFSERCDSGTDEAEDCRVTLGCDHSLRQYATCVKGECRCQAVPCTDKSECQEFHHCRDDDEQVSCLPEPNLYPTAEGVCQCTGRGTGCLFNTDMNSYCAREVPCTEKGFSKYPEFSRCVSSDSWLTYPRGRCDCQPVFCKLAKERDSGEKACREQIDCEGGKKPLCKPRDDGDSKEGGDGYCTCEP